MIPAGNWSDIRSLLQQSVVTGEIDAKTNILSFFQTRSIPNIDFLEAYADESKECRRGPSESESCCLTKKKNATYLQAYDCERTTLPKPAYGWRAQKQIYRPDFVWNHFVHYSTVTRRIQEDPKEESPLFIQRRPYERRVDELKEAFMLHTKTTYPSATKSWKRFCQGVGDDEKKKCPIGVPYDMDLSAKALNESEQTKDGFARNCYPHRRIQDDLVFKLEELLRPLISEVGSIEKMQG